MKNFARTLAIACAAPLIVGLVVLAFIWPTATMTPHNMPVAIVGPDQAVTQVETTMAEKNPDMLDVTRLQSRDEAVHAIETREVYGAIVLPDGPGAAPEVLTSSAASAVTNGMLTGMATGLEGQVNAQAAAAAQAKGVPADKVPHVSVITTDVVPLAANDQGGQSLAMIVMPLAFGSIIGAALLSFGLKAPKWRALGLLIYAPLAALATTLVMHTWLDMLPGDFWPIAGVFALTFLAIGGFIAGVYSALNHVAGFGLGALTILLIANPLAAAAYPHQFLPGAWGTIGQYMPNGAGASLMRSVVYFPEASIAPQVTVQLVWVAVGAALLFLGQLVHGKRIAREQRAERESLTSEAVA